MSAHFPQLPAQLGTYTLTQYLGRHESTDLYLATQSHVERGVVVEVLDSECEQEITARFLNQARARVAARLPHVSQVFESMITDGIWHIAYERPKGKTISQLIAAGETLRNAVQVCAIIKAAAEMYSRAAESNIAAGCVPADSIFVKNEREATFLSPVLPGSHSPDLRATQMSSLADVLQAVLPTNVPGQNRIATLLSWMRYGYEGEALEWHAIASTAKLISEQLAPVLNKESINRSPKTTAGTLKRRAQRNRRKALRFLGVSAIVTLGVAAITGLGLLFIPKQKTELPAHYGKYVACKTERGIGRTLARPVTIEEYQKFLSRLDDIRMQSPQQLARINKGIPDNSQTYIPENWSSQLEAAERGKKWNGEKLSSQSPVRGVSYWDALAYANYMKAELPTAELLQAVRNEVGAEKEIEEWTASTTDGEFPYAGGYLIMPNSVQGKPRTEPNPNRRQNYGFRIFIPKSTSADPS